MISMERAVGLVLRVGVAASSITLSLGLILALAGEATLGSALLQAGLIILLGTPVARVAISVVEYIVERDWTFTTLTVIVLLELLASVVTAFVGRGQ